MVDIKHRMSFKNFSGQILFLESLKDRFPSKSNYLQYHVEIIENYIKVVENYYIFELNERKLLLDSLNNYYTILLSLKGLVNEESISDEMFALKFVLPEFCNYHKDLVRIGCSQLLNVSLSYTIFLPILSDNLLLEDFFKNLSSLISEGEIFLLKERINNLNKIYLQQKFKDVVFDKVINKNYGTGTSDQDLKDINELL